MQKAKFRSIYLTNFFLLSRSNAHKGENNNKETREACQYQPVCTRILFSVIIIAMVIPIINMYHLIKIEQSCNFKLKSFRKVFRSRNSFNRSLSKYD